MMEKVKNFAETKGIGFWVSAGILILMLVMTIIYPVYFYYSQYWDGRTLVFLIIGLVLGLGLMVGGIFFKPLAEWAPAAIGGCVFLATLFFFWGTWLNIQDALGGYEARGMAPGFWGFAVLAIISIVASIVNIIVLRQNKNIA